MSKCLFHKNRALQYLLSYTLNMHIYKKACQCKTCIASLRINYSLRTMVTSKKQEYFVKK